MNTGQTCGGGFCRHDHLCADRYCEGHPCNGWSAADTDPPKWLWILAYAAALAVILLTPYMGL